MRNKGIFRGGLVSFVLLTGFVWVLCSAGSAGLYAAGADTSYAQSSVGQPQPFPPESTSSSYPAASGTVQKKTGKAAASKGQAPGATARRPVQTTGGVMSQADAGVSDLQNATQKQYSGKPISLDLLDADLRNVLRLIADLTGTNIVIEPDVTGKVTLKVEQVPWDQVLDMVLSMNDLGKEQAGNVIRIAKRGKLRQEWAQQAEAIRAKQDLAETAKDLGELSTVYYSVSFAKPAEIATKISESKSDRGKVAVDERTSLIIYTDYPARLNYARQLLSRLDRPTPQVLIEARIVTLTNEVTKNLGANLGISSISPATGDPTQSFAINSPATNFFTMGFGTLVNKALVNIDLTLQALETANEIRIMAAPRVVTLDNVKAVISQGVQIPYLKVGDTSSGVTGTEFKDAVLELQVTPHITPDHKVRMTIEAKQDEPSATVVGASGQVGIDTRKVSTEMLVDDGNVVVIGGVIRNRDALSKSSTPGLSDIPILGRLFKIEESKIQRNELLIFISPRIIEVTKPADRT